MVKHSPLRPSCFQTTTSGLPEVDEVGPQVHPLFSDTDADTVLSSNDNIWFRLPRVTLRKASRYFQNVFDSSMSGVANDDKPTVYAIPFPTAPLERVLSLISGLPLLLEDLSFYEVEAMVDVMRHLDTPGPLANIRAVVVQQFSAEPVLVYGLATKLGWDDIAQQAAELTLPINILSTTDDTNTNSLKTQLCHLPHAPSFLSILHLHQRRKDIFRSQIHSRVLFRITCGLCCEPVQWRLLVARLIDELDKDCSGRSILTPGGVEAWSETRKCWKGSPCKNERCDFRKGMSNRARTLGEIRGIIERLPTELPMYR